MVDTISLAAPLNNLLSSSASSGHLHQEEEEYFLGKMGKPKNRYRNTSPKKYLKAGMLSAHYKDKPKGNLSLPKANLSLRDFSSPTFDFFADYKPYQLPYDIYWWGLHQQGSTLTAPTTWFQCSTCKILLQKEDGMKTHVEGKHEKKDGKRKRDWIVHSIPVMPKFRFPKPGSNSSQNDGGQPGIDTPPPPTLIPEVKPDSQNKDIKKDSSITTIAPTEGAEKKRRGRRRRATHGTGAPSKQQDITVNNEDVRSSSSSPVRRRSVRIITQEIKECPTLKPSVKVVIKTEKPEVNAGLGGNNVASLGKAVETITRDVFEFTDDEDPPPDSYKTVDKPEIEKDYPEKRVVENVEDSKNDENLGLGHGQQERANDENQPIDEYVNESTQAVAKELENVVQAIKACENSDKEQERTSVSSDNHKSVRRGSYDDTSGNGKEKCKGGSEDDKWSIYVEDDTSSPRQIDEFEEAHGSHQSHGKPDIPKEASPLNIPTSPETSPEPAVFITNEEAQQATLTVQEMEEEYEDAQILNDEHEEENSHKKQSEGTQCSEGNGDDIPIPSTEEVASPSGQKGVNLEDDDKPESVADSGVISDNESLVSSSCGSSMIGKSKESPSSPSKDRDQAHSNRPIRNTKKKHTCPCCPSKSGTHRKSSSPTRSVHHSHPGKPFVRTYGRSKTVRKPEPPVCLVQPIVKAQITTAPSVPDVGNKSPKPHTSGSSIHQNKTKDYKRYLCSFCHRSSSKLYRSRLSVRKHISLEHGDIISDNLSVSQYAILKGPDERDPLEASEGEESEGEPVFKCTTCSATFVDQSHYAFHRVQHTRVWREMDEKEKQKKIREFEEIAGQSNPAPTLPPLPSKPRKPNMFQMSRVRKSTEGSMETLTSPVEEIQPVIVTGSVRSLSNETESTPPEKMFRASDENEKDPLQLEEDNCEDEIEIVIPTGDLKCKICCGRFAVARQLQIHELRHTPYWRNLQPADQQEFQTNLDSTPAIYRCPYPSCNGRGFRSLAQLIDHASKIEHRYVVAMDPHDSLSSSTNEVYFCVLCNSIVKCKTHREMTRHFLADHRNKEPRIQCIHPGCPVSYPNTCDLLLKFHVITHSQLWQDLDPDERMDLEWVYCFAPPEKPMTCPIQTCGILRTFSGNNEFRDHFHSVHDEVFVKLEEEENEMNDNSE